MRNVLISGGAGFIGTALSLKLIEKGYCLTILDNLSQQIHGGHSPKIPEEARFINGSVTSRKDWEKALKGQDILLHLASETGTGQSMYEVRKYVDVNSEGTAILLDLLAKHKHHITKVILASSRAIYGEGKYESEEHGIVYPKPRTINSLDQGVFDVHYNGNTEKLRVLPTDEESKVHPSSIYGITKQNQEQLVETVCKALGIDYTIFRYQNVYGPGQSLKNPYTGILSIFSTQIKNNNGINIFEDGQESRDFVYIDDVVQATLLGIEKEEANGETFNVGSGEAINILTVVNELIKNYGIDVPITISGHYRLGDVRHNYADLKKIIDALNFKPKISFKEGIKKFTDWVNTQEIEKDGFFKSIREMKRRGIYK